MGTKKVELKKFEGMQTEWLGIWKNENYNGYMSQSINLNVLKEFKGNVRFYLRKNRYYKKDSDRPFYVLCVKDSKSPTFSINASVEEDRAMARIGHDDSEIVTGMVFSHSDLQSLINKVACYIGGDGEYGEHLVEDFMTWDESEFIAIPGTY